MAIKLADTLAPMSEFPAAMAEHIGFSDGATLQEKFDNKELGGGDSSVTLTQEEYEALPEEEKLDGLYYTYDTKRIYKNGVQYGASEPIPLTMEEYKALKAAGAIDEQQEYLVEADAEGILLGAEDIGYNNAESGIEATTVQGAIDKVAEKVDGLIDDEVSDSTVWSSQKTSDELDIVKKISQGSTPFKEIYGNSTSYHKLTVKCFYARPQIFEITASNEYMGRIEVIMYGSELSRTSVIVTNYQGTIPIEVKYDNVQSIATSGYCSVDLFIYKKNAGTISLDIYPVYQGDARYATLYTSDDFITSTADEFTSATMTASYKQIPTLSDTTTSETSTWSSSKIASSIVGSKTQYRGSRSIDISTGGKLTLIYSSEYASQAGCYMLLSNFNTEPLLIELGRTGIGQFKVTATHKSENVDTITVTAAGDAYSWYVLQF